MEKKYLLPALKKNIVIDSNECWEAASNTYDFLIENLRLHYEPTASVFEGGSNAVPHIFEQMIVFHKAFLDEKNAEHDRAVAEWRAVLSIMALQRICNVKLDLIRIDLSGETNNPFLRAACDFRPEDAPVFFNTTWDFVYVLRLKKIPIAIFSPVTLVCPAKNFLKKVKQYLDNDWLLIEQMGRGKEELVFDFKGEKREMQALVKWLKRLERSITCSDSAKGECFDKFEKVSEQLNEFIQEYDLSAGPEADSPILVDVYDSINNNIRKEYDFLNNSCDLSMENEKLRFLIQRYQDDIFEEKLLVLVYDDAPDTMEKVENIEKLKKAYRNILEIEKDKPIIEVCNNGGVRMAACVFLPFKSFFVEELIQNHVTPEEFFGLFTATYIPVAKQMDIVLQIKGFPYCFRKKYPVKNWQYLYGRDMEATYIWPASQINTAGWQDYYIYTEETEKSQAEVSVPQAVRRVKYIRQNSSKRENAFQLCKSHTFPAYLCYTYQGTKGFLPIRAGRVGTREAGPVANVFIDIGHATTSISIVKGDGSDVQKNMQKEGQEIRFYIPRSCRIAGNREKSEAVRMNFVTPDEEGEQAAGCIKNMMHSFRDYQKIPLVEKTKNAFEDGQILFDSSAYLNDFQESVVSYINFEYVKMDEVQRNKLHIFLEQLFTYIVYQIIARECSYLRVYFLHSYRDGDTRLGELKGLWKNVLRNVRERTGINAAGTEDVIAVRDCEALAHYVYGQAYKKELQEEKQISDDSLNIGINIGWKNTNVAILEADEKRIMANWKTIEYAGRNITMLADADEESWTFPVYPLLLNILLHGEKDLSSKTDVEKMLDEFADLFRSRKKDIEHYQGVFDVIAMKIEEFDFKVSPDVYNNMPEFRYFIMALTYNLMLLFLNAGLSIGGYVRENTKKINIYLGGNGAKIFKWISNIKNFKEITIENEHETFILPLENGIIEYFKSAAGINSNITEIKIILADKPEEQLIQGSRIRAFARDNRVPEFQYKDIGNRFSTSGYNKFVNLMNGLQQEIFQEFPVPLETGVPLGSGTGNTTITELMEKRRKEVCWKVVDEINYINSSI